MKYCTSNIETQTLNHLELRTHQLVCENSIVRQTSNRGQRRWLYMPPRRSIQDSRSTVVNLHSFFLYTAVYRFTALTPPTSSAYDEQNAWDTPPVWSSHRHSRVFVTSSNGFFSGVKQSIIRFPHRPPIVAKFFAGVGIGTTNSGWVV